MYENCVLIIAFFQDNCIALFFSDLDKFDFYKFSEHYDDYKYAMELTSEILFLEVIYRILVCIFEVGHAFTLNFYSGTT